MNIKRQLESKLSEIYYSNSGDDYDEYLNVDNDAEEILQSILKAIMERKPKNEWHSPDHDCGAYECSVSGRNKAIKEFESVIKEVLSEAKKK